MEIAAFRTSGVAISAAATGDSPDNERQKFHYCYFTTEDAEDK